MRTVTELNDQDKALLQQVFTEAIRGHLRAGNRGAAMDCGRLLTGLLYGFPMTQDEFAAEVRSYPERKEAVKAVKDVYLLVKALVPEGTQPAEVRDAALEALNMPASGTLHWTWDAAISER